MTRTASTKSSTAQRKVRQDQKAKERRAPAPKAPAGPPSRPLSFDDPELTYRGMSNMELRLAELVFQTLQRPRLARLGSRAVEAGLAVKVPLVESALYHTVFRLFCGGTDLVSALNRVERLHAAGVRSILDYAVEGEKTDQGFEETKDIVLRTIAHAARHDGVSHCALKLTGLAPFELLAKKHRGQKLNSAEEAKDRDVTRRVKEIAQEAARVGVPIFVDAEESWIQRPIDDLARELMETHNRTTPIVHTTVQLYLRDGLSLLERLIGDARKGGYIFGLKLVRGAYLEKENARADKLGIPRPTQPSRQATDEAYNQALSLCMDNFDHVALCAATHNVESVTHLLKEMEQRGVRPDDERIVFAQLLGMLDRLTVPLAHHGYNSSKYVPFGEVKRVMPYLLRRADENMSVAAQSAGELALIRLELKRRRQGNSSNDRYRA